MKSVSVRDLRYDFKKVERLLAAGDEIQITKRRTVIARIVPEPRRPVPLPDFQARIKAIYGDKVLSTTGAEVVSWDRDGR